MLLQWVRRMRARRAVRAWARECLARAVAEAYTIEERLAGELPDQERAQLEIERGWCAAVIFNRTTEISARTMP